MYQQGYNIYKNNSVNYASKEQLLLMLVDGGVRFVKVARQAIIDKDVKTAHHNLMKAQDVFTELIISLDTKQAPWTKQLLQIYTFIKKKLAQANMSKDLKDIDEVMPLIQEIRDMWHETYKKAKSQGM